MKKPLVCKAIQHLSGIASAIVQITKMDRDHVWPIRAYGCGSSGIYKP